MAAQAAESNLLKTPCGCCFIFVWLLWWSIATLAFDIRELVTVARILRARSFPTAAGVITRSEVQTTHDSDGTTNRFDVAYEYEVDGRQYTGTRYAYGAPGTNTRAWHTVRDGLPVGTRVPVSYDPTDPAESVLEPGPVGFHLNFVWFLTPFNVVMIMGWVWVACGRRPAFDPTDPRTATPTPTGWRVPLFDAGRLGNFAGLLLAITFCGTFVWACGFGFNPPVWLAGWGYVVAVVVSGAAAAWYTLPWLEVDEVARVIRLPAASLEVPFAVIRDVIVTHEEKKDSDGDVSHKYHCELVRSDAAPDELPVRITTYQQRPGAEAFVAWLRERMAIATPDAGNVDGASVSVP